tara:strand:- start:33 stop:218 length:186 start_codon:yes stop_codon:yes gene_type:complete
MTKKDYVVFADMLKKYISKQSSKTPTGEMVLLGNITQDIETIFSKDNINFDKNKFYEYIKK